MTTEANGPAAGVPLAPHHYAMLHDESGISDEMIAARGYRTITAAADLERLSFAPVQRRAPSGSVSRLSRSTCASVQTVRLRRPRPGRKNALAELQRQPAF